MKDPISQFVHHPATGPYESIEVWRWNKANGYGYLHKVFIKPGGYYIRKRLYNCRRYRHEEQHDDNYDD